MGYHLTKIEKGVLGEPTKIREELEELLDALTQGDKILMLCELSDLLGAIEAYSDKEHKSKLLYLHHSSQKLDLKSLENLYRDILMNKKYNTKEELKHLCEIINTNLILFNMDIQDGISFMNKTKGAFLDGTRN